MKTIQLVIRLALLALPAPAALLAAVPVRWTVETSRVQPAVFEAYQGETLELDATLQSYGKPISNALQDARIYWQTNGMGSAYWSAPASADGNTLRASWTPAMDVGARAYNCFIGSPSNSYRAAFQLRLRPSPGATPNALPLPTPRLDFAQVEVANAPWLDEESDPTVPAWAKAATKPTYTAGEVGALPLVEDEYGAKTAVTIGRRIGAVGEGSLVNGWNVSAPGKYSHAEGAGTMANADYSHADGAGAVVEYGDIGAFAWSGDFMSSEKYHSNGHGTFSINPIGGLDGFYIGSQTLASILTNKADTADISAGNHTFSNAVMAVTHAFKTNTYTKTETDSLIAANKPEYEDVPSNVVWRIEAEGGRFFFKPVRPINMED